MTITWSVALLQHHLPRHVTSWANLTHQCTDDCDWFLSRLPPALLGPCACAEGETQSQTVIFRIGRRQTPPPPRRRRHASTRLRAARNTAAAGRAKATQGRLSRASTFPTSASHSADGPAVCFCLRVFQIRDPTRPNLSGLFCVMLTAGKLTRASVASVHTIASVAAASVVLRLITAQFNRFTGVINWIDVASTESHKSPVSLSCVSAREQKEYQSCIIPSTCATLPSQREFTSF